MYCQQTNVNNKEEEMTERTHFKSNKTLNKRNHSLFTNKHTSHVTEAGGISFYDPQKTRALSQVWYSRV